MSEKSYSNQSFFEQSTEPFAVAHRANSQKALDDAREIFEDYDLPCYAEVDVAHTVDENLLIYHGSNNPWQRYVKKQGISINELTTKTFSEVHNLDVDNKPIETLEDILRNNPDYNFFVHLKTDVAGRLLANMLNDNEGLRNQVSISSFKKTNIKEFNKTIDKEKGHVSTAISFEDAAIESLLLMRENAKKNKYRAIANTALQLSGISHLNANDYWDSLEVDNWLASRHTTENMLRVVQENLQVPMTIHYSLPSYTTSKQIDKKLEEGFNGIMGDDIRMICAAVARKRNGL